MRAAPARSIETAIKVRKANRGVLAAGPRLDLLIRWANAEPAEPTKKAKIVKLALAAKRATEARMAESVQPAPEGVSA